MTEERSGSYKTYLVPRNLLNFNSVKVYLYNYMGFLHKVLNPKLY